MKLSVVTPVLNEAEGLPAFWRRLQPVLRELSSEFEVIFVDDGSTDSSWEKITAFHREAPQAKGIRLACHKGHQVAFWVGLRHASGEAIITLDSDLQHPPEKIPELIPHWRRGFDLVYGCKTEQLGRSGIKKRLNHLFGKLFSLRSGVEFPPEASDFQLLDRRLVEKVTATWRAPFFLRGWIHGLASKKQRVPFRADQRKFGKTKHRFSSLSLLGIYSLIFFPSRRGFDKMSRSMKQKPAFPCPISETLGLRPETSRSETFQ